MRASLKGVLSRVDRLADHVRPSPEDEAAKMEAMSDEEICARLVELARMPCLRIWVGIPGSIRRSRS